MRIGERITLLLKSTDIFCISKLHIYEYPFQFLWMQEKISYTDLKGTKNNQLRTYLYKLS